MFELRKSYKKKTKGVLTYNHVIYIVNLHRVFNNFVKQVSLALNHNLNGLNYGLQLFNLIRLCSYTFYFLYQIQCMEQNGRSKERTHTQLIK